MLSDRFSTFQKVVWPGYAIGFTHLDDLRITLDNSSCASRVVLPFDQVASSFLRSFALIMPPPLHPPATGTSARSLSAEFYLSALCRIDLASDTASR